MGRHSRPTAPPLRKLGPLVDLVSAGPYLFAAALTGTALGAAVVGWWL